MKKGATTLGRATLTASDTVLHLITTLLSVIILSITSPCFVMLNVTLVMLSVEMPSVLTASVVAPPKNYGLREFSLSSRL
jgi:hypothetical protein